MTTVGSLFAGIGGWDLGLAAAGATTAWACEAAAFPADVLRARLGVPVLPDVHDLDGGTPRVDVLAGGFPCQDLSAAGRGAGLYGPRSGLWFEYARLIGELRPRVVLIENVPPLRRRGLGALLRGLHDLGYDAEFDGIPAAAVGAPHLRDRIWIVAYPIGTHVAPVAFGPPNLFPIAALDDAVVYDDHGWPRAGMTRGGSIYELDPVAPVTTSRIDGRAYWAGPRLDAGTGRPSLLPTPAARDHKDTGPNTDYARIAAKSKLPGVLVQAERGLWPTPKASPSGPDYARAARDRSGGDDLATALARVDPGMPNPAWVEWMMGFPVGWTDVDDTAPQPRAFDDDPHPTVPRTRADVPARADRLTAIGNALVPQAAAYIARRVLPTLGATR